MMKKANKNKTKFTEHIKASNILVQDREDVISSLTEEIDIFMHLQGKKQDNIGIINLLTI